MMMEAEQVQCIKNMRNRTTKLDREGDYWTEEEKTLLANMFEQGVGITEMAVLLQRTEPAVMQQIESMDLYRRKENPIRRRAGHKIPDCLCSRCKLDASFCPRCQVFCEAKGGYDA